jgi:phage-related baseplate assembly protein
MTLPEPNFIDRDIDTITREWIALYEEKTGKTLEPAQIERLLIDVGVYRENLLRIKIQETAKQNLVNFAAYPILDYLGELVGVTRIPAQKSSTTITFNLIEPLDFILLIPKNTQIETKDGNYIFETQADTFIPAGSSNVQIKAVSTTAGASVNGYLQGEVNNLITPLPYIAKAENIQTTAGGADEETDEQLRERIKQAPEQFSNAGCKGAYKFHTFSAHPDIIDVSVLSPSAGVVEIYPLTKIGNPSRDIIQVAQSYLVQDHIKPLTDYVVVKSPEKVDFQIKASLILYSFADAESVFTQAKEVLNDYCASLRKKLGKDIIQTQIITLLNSVYGVYKVILNRPAETILDLKQWANCTDVTLELGGYVNE